MARYPNASWVPAGTPGGPITPRVVIVHSEATVGHALPHSGLEWHFWIGFDGHVEQLVDTGVRADANNYANSFAISIETEDNGHPDVEPWTQAQLDSLIAVIRWACATHSIPLRRCDGPYGSGVGFHTMWGAPSAWTPVVKTCPGAVRKAQFESVIIPALTGTPTVPAPPKPVTSPKPTGGSYVASKAPLTVKRGSKGQYVRNLQGLLLAVAPDLVVALPGSTEKFVDGDFGPNTEKVLKTWQSRTRVLEDDGICGPRTWEYIVGVDFA